MTNTVTRKPLQVRDGGTAGPYMSLPESQVAQVCAVLDANGFRYEVDEDAYSIDGQPEVTYISFAWNTDRSAVQRVLDALP